MNNYIIVYPNELNHHGVKGMKWGVRKDPQVASARYNYKMAKKQYNKDFNSWYNKGIAAYSPVKKHRRNNEVRYQKALVSAGELAIKKGQYKVAKGKATGNSKMVNKGKYAIKQARIAKNYNSNILSDLNAGKTWRESTNSRKSEFDAGVAAQRKNRADYKKQKYMSKYGG